MANAGKLELVVKITVLPAEVSTDANGWKAFVIDCDGVRAVIKVRPKLWTKLEQGASTWPSWVAAIAGRMGKRTADGFELEEPAIQVFERKAKPEPAPQPPQ